MRFFVVLFMSLWTLSACSNETQTHQTTPSTQTASSASATVNPIASAILNVPQSEDILISSKQAMRDITASDVAAISDTTYLPDTLIIANDTEIASSLAELPPLPTTCQQYFQRAQNCFQQQAHADGLLNLLQQQQLELANEQADENSCQNLARSFDAVANNLGCH